MKIGSKSNIVTSNVKIWTIEEWDEFVNERMNASTNNILDLSGVHIMDKEIMGKLRIGRIPGTFRFTKLIVKHWKFDFDKVVLKQIFSSLDVFEIEGLETWETHNLFRIVSLFKNCVHLRKVNLKEWDLSKCDIIYRMFAGCMALEKVEGIENWDVSECDDFEGCFHKCMNLKADLRKWNVKDDANFEDCFTLTTEKIKKSLNV